MKRLLFASLAIVALVSAPPANAMTSNPHDKTAICLPSPVTTVKEAPVSVSSSHIDSIGVARQTAGDPAAPFKVIAGMSLLGLIGFGLVGSINDTVADDKDSYPTRQGSRIQINNLVKDVAYALTHRPAWQVAAAAVAPPLLALATDVKTVKSTNTTQLMVNGVLTSLTATDPLMVVANMAASDPNVLAIGSVRKWQVCWDATNATTVITLRPSNDQVIANFASAALALAACRWPNLPPKGTVIVGVVSITNVTNAFTPGTTALNAAGVTMVVVDGPTQDCLLASLISP